VNHVATAGRYSTRDLSRLAALSPRQVRSWVESGLLRPDRGERGEYRFSFQDLALLRTVRDLVDADLPERRVRRALSLLRRDLPADRPLTSVRVNARMGELVVYDGDAAWEPESGQAVFDFTTERSNEVHQLTPTPAGFDPAASLSAQDWYELACDIEATAPHEAEAAYRRALSAAPEHADALVNLGRLLHESGRLADAEKLYRRAAAARPDDATAAFNLGVLLEDRLRPDEAALTYRHAIELDASYADAHYNLARLYERLSRRAAALRHLRIYKRLTER